MGPHCGASLLVGIMALNGLYCADVLLSNCSLTSGWNWMNYFDKHNIINNITDSVSFRRITHCFGFCTCVLLINKEKSLPRMFRNVQKFFFSKSHFKL